MTETTYLGAAALGYLADVELALKRLAPDERDELLEQVHEHLDSMISDVGRDVSREELQARLGPPDRYAAELINAAGFAVSDLSAAPEQSLLSRSMDALPAFGSAAVAYLRRLAPAWWAVRAYLIAGLVLPLSFGLRGVTHGGTSAPGKLFGRWTFDDMWVSSNNWHALWIVPIAAAITGSVAVGLRAERGIAGARLGARLLDLAGIVSFVLVPSWWCGQLLYDFVLRRFSS